MAEKSWYQGQRPAPTPKPTADTAEDFLRSSSSTFASQLVSLVIAFVALYLIVSRIALPRVGSVIDARQNAIEGDLAAGAEAEGRVRRCAEGV